MGELAALVAPGGRPRGAAGQPVGLGGEGLQRAEDCALHQVAAEEDEEYAPLYGTAEGKTRRSSNF